ncbi:hypothetical protein SGLAM104S_04633 [Streptomyces glaucescens]
MALVARSAAPQGLQRWAYDRSRRPAMRAPRSPTQPRTRACRSRKSPSTARVWASMTTSSSRFSRASLKLTEPVTEAPLSRISPRARNRGTHRSSLMTTSTT